VFFEKDTEQIPRKRAGQIENAGRRLQGNQAKDFCTEFTK